MRNCIPFLLAAAMVAGGVRCAVAGSSIFSLTNTLSVGANPASVAVADVNGDGKLDLISADSGATTLTILTNNGLGEFGSCAVLQVGANPDSVVAADVNGDGKVDLISANFGANGTGNTLTVMTNNGFGVFGFNSTLTVGLGPTYVTAVSLRGGTNLDLVCADANTSMLTVLTNDGRGGFSHSADYPVGDYPVSIAVADVNGDGKLDLVCANANDGTLTVLTNNGHAGFAVMTNILVGSGAGSTPYSVLAVDVNGDGKIDLVSANAGDSTLTVLTNNGAGVFILAATLPVDQTPACVTAADVNGDGWPDLISASYDDGTLTILTNDGSGNFVYSATLGTDANPFFVAVADVTGFGLPDLISANNGSTTLSLFYNLPYPPLISSLQKTGAQNVTISWLEPPPGFVLRQNSDLTATNWSSFGGPVNDDGVIQSVTTDTSADQMFFRLANP